MLVRLHTGSWQRTFVATFQVHYSLPVNRQKHRQQTRNKVYSVLCQKNGVLIILSLHLYVCLPLFPLSPSPPLSLSLFLSLPPLSLPLPPSFSPLPPGEEGSRGERREREGLDAVQQTFKIVDCNTKVLSNHIRCLLVCLDRPLTVLAYFIKITHQEQESTPTS